MQMRTTTVLLALVAAASSALFGAQAPAISQPIALDAFTVTGTNLRAGESVGAANLRVLTPTEIEASGQTNLANLLRKIPEIGAQGFAENRVNTSSPGTARRHAEQPDDSTGQHSEDVSRTLTTPATSAGAAPRT